MNFPLLAYRYLTQVWKWLASSPLAALRVFCLVESCTLHVSHPHLAPLLPLPGHLFGLLETKQKQNPPAHRPSRKSRKAVRLALHHGSHCDFLRMAEGRVAVSVAAATPLAGPQGLAQNGEGLGKDPLCTDGAPSPAGGKGRGIQRGEGSPALSVWCYLGANQAPRCSEQLTVEPGLSRNPRGWRALAAAQAELRPAGLGPAPEGFAVWLQRECTGARCGEPAPCLEQWGRAAPVPRRTPSLLLSPLQVPHGRVLRRGQHEGGRRGL